MIMNIRDIDLNQDAESILALNHRYERELSPLTLDGLTDLLSEAHYRRVTSNGEGFLLVFNEGANYSSENFQWMKQHFERFMYIDRVAVSPNHQGKGIARALYEDLFSFALKEGYQHVLCEVNHEPPNLPSERFHHQLGFIFLDRVTLKNGKVVNYLKKAITLN